MKRTMAVAILLVAWALQGCAATLPDADSAPPLADSTEAPTYDWQGAADTRRAQEEDWQRMQDSTAASQAQLAQEMEQSRAFDAQIQAQTQ